MSDLIRIHLWIDRYDVERLDRLFHGNIGRSKGIGSILRNYLNNLEANVPALQRPVARQEAEQ